MSWTAAERGQEHDRRELPVGAQGLADVPAVGVGQPDVEDEHVEGVVGAEQPDGLASVVGDDDLVAGQLHRLDHDPTDGGVVLAQADSGHRQHLVSARRLDGSTVREPT